MNRSPLFYPLNRGGDAEGGGAADLQTDVMRFMAILSLCLVAIFALVQSIPPAPVLQKAAQPESTPERQAIEMGPEPPIEEALAKIEIKLVRPAPAKLAVPKEQIVLQRPTPAPIRSTDPTPLEVVPEAPSLDAKPREEGFTLQFESDSALTRLVAQQVVGFYAITPGASSRMNVEGDAISFWPASVPNKFHEMDRSTVPDEVLVAYGSDNRSSDIKWGVTLPANMSRELNGYLSNENGGSLVIAGNGRIALRR